MAFLDNLLSDLIRNSTGFNAKPFVRAVGGKNILLLGGAVIAGAIAAEKMRSQQPAAGAPPLPPFHRSLLPSLFLLFRRFPRPYLQNPSFPVGSSSPSCGP